MSFKAAQIFKSDFSDSSERLAQAVGENLRDETLNIKSLPLFQSNWLELIDHGWQSCFIPESFGGLDGNLTDFCALLEAANRHALRLPIALGFGIPAVLLSSLKTAMAGELLSSIAKGETRFQPVLMDPFGSDVRDEQDSLKASIDENNNIQIDGRISGIEQIPASTDILLICPLIDLNNSNSFVVAHLSWNDVNDWHAQAERIDGRTTISLEFNKTLNRDQILATAQDAETALSTVRNFGCLFSCVGSAAAMGVNIEHTIQYLLDRHQFGVSLASFQVLRHYIATIYAKYECYRALVHAFVADTQQANDIDLEKLAMLKIYLGQAGQTIVHTVIQVHGGMGMTEELFASKLNKSILMAGFEYGDALFHANNILNTRAATI